MPGFNIDNFKGALDSRNGLMRPNKFLLQFVSPLGIQSQDTGNIYRDMEFWCESITIPGYFTASYDARRYTYGPVEKRPLTPIFQPIQCVFNSDGNGDYLTFFNNWMQCIMPHDWHNSFNEISNYSGGSMYEVEYKANYITDLHLYIFGANGGTSGSERRAGNVKPIMHYIIKQAFPEQVFDIPLSWSESGNVKFQVNFQYLDWTFEQDTIHRYETNQAGNIVLPSGIQLKQPPFENAGPPPPGEPGTGPDAPSFVPRRQQ